MMECLGSMIECPINCTWCCPSHCLLAVLASIDFEEVRKYLPDDHDGAPLTADDYLTVTKQGHKGSLKRRFMETLDTCAAANKDTLDKVLTILASQLRDELTRWVRFGVGLEQIRVDSACEMISSRCILYWSS